MAVLSVMAIEGDADALAAKMRDTIAPVAARKAPQYGGISTTVVRTDNGIKVFNLWETEEGRHQMAEDPEVLAAVREAGYPQPAFRAHEVLYRRTVGEANEEIVRRFSEEVWTKHNLDVIDELVASDCVGWSPTDGEIRGPDGFRQLAERYLTAFPDTSWRIDRVVAAGEWVASYWTATGTHSGDLMGIAPTGKQVTVQGSSFDRIVNGKFVESQNVFDALGMLQQLGAIPMGVATTA
jgi:steroid delta-isomerase-like uncharacterized protein